MIDNYFIFATLAFTVVAIPGPAVVLTIKNSIRYGCHIAIANILGNFMAMVILASLSAFSLGTIIVSSTLIFTSLKIIGCIYLVFLGIKAWRTPVVYQAEFPALSGQTRTFLSVLQEGFYVGIANPKAIAFFTALFPHFINPTRNVFPQFATLIMTIEGISFLVLMLYALVAAQVATYLLRGATLPLFNKVTGIAFVSFGFALLYER
jgi:homoserine/homoserine lactone efflux protein